MSGLSAPRIIFGIHSLSPYSRVDRTPYGILKVIGSASLALNSSVEQLYGGASRFSWAAESKTISSEFTAKVKAYPGFLYQLWLGATVTTNAGEATGSVSALTNVKGTSVMKATTGIASLAITSGSNGDVKFGNFLIVAASATTVDVYALSDVDFGRGADVAAYQNDALKITATALTVTSTATTDIPKIGITLTGGSGSIGMTTGDTAMFTTRPENSVSEDVIIGNSLTSLPAFGAVILAMKRATGEMFEIEAFNAIGYGMPIPMDEMAFSTTELKVVCLYDSVQNAVFKIRTVTPLSFN